MEEYYIRVKLGKTIEHPISGENLRMLYPNLNPEKLPEGYERFTRLPHPEISVFQKHTHTEYVKTNYGWTDNHVVVDVGVELPDINLPADKTFPMKPNDGEEYFWADSAGKWINYKIFEGVFRDFFIKNNLKYEDIDFTSMNDLNDEQRKQFKKLIHEYDKLAGDFQPSR